MKKLLKVDHLHQSLKNIYFHDLDGGFHMEFTAATAQEARNVRNAFNSFMVRAPGNMNFDLVDTLSDQVKTGEFGFGAVGVSGNISTALVFLKSKRLLTDEIYQLILDDKDLTDFLKASSLYKSEDEALVSDDEKLDNADNVITPAETSVRNSQAETLNTNNVVVQPNASNNISFTDQTSPKTPPSVKVK